jgi:hypothetical protein
MMRMAGKYYRRPPFLPMSAMCSRFWLTALPPRLAISRCFEDSIEAKPLPPFFFGAAFLVVTVFFVCVFFIVLMIRFVKNNAQVNDVLHCEEET